MIDLQRSLDRKKAVEEKRNLKKIVIIQRTVGKSEVLQIFRGPNGISALLLLSFIVFIYSGLTL